jgi:branched-chain amino acid transport system ATP-binding protein
VPEGRRIFPGLTVRENIMLGATSRGKLTRKVMADDVEKMFAIFPDIKRFENSLGWTLSGGQQQMLAVARGLMAMPKLLLLDEPSLGLAPKITDFVFDMVRQLRAEGLTVLLVEQKARQTLKIADRAYLLETGRVVTSGLARDLIDDKVVSETFLGGTAATG